MKPILKLYKDIEKPLKYAIIIALFLFAVYKVQSVSVHLSKIEMNFSKYLLFILVVALAGVNWFLEVKKWQILKAMPLKRAANTVFNGLVANLFIPAGVGDLSYRTFSDNDKKNNFVKSLQNSFAQFIPTLLVGMFGFFLLPGYSEFKQFKVGILVAITLFSLFFILKKPVNRRITVLSFLRYGVFLLQCYFLFYIFSVRSISYLDLWKYIALFFLIRTLIPSFLMAELGIRASLAILVFGAFSQYLGNIILAFTILLLVNNYIPAIIYKTFGLSWLKKLSFA